MWRVRKDGGLARADRVATLREKAAEDAGQRPRPTRCSASPGAPPRRSAPRRSRRADPTVNAVPDLMRRAAIVVLGTFAVISMLAVVHPLAARGAGQPAGHAEPGQGALVLPLAPGDRHRHHLHHRRLHGQRRVPGRSDPARAAPRAAHRVAVARPLPGRGHGRLVPRQPPQAEPRVPALRARRRRCSPSSARSCAARPGTSSGPGRRGRRSPRGSEHGEAHRLTLSRGSTGPCSR